MKFHRDDDYEEIIRLRNKLRAYEKSWWVSIILNIGLGTLVVIFSYMLGKGC